MVPFFNQLAFVHDDDLIDVLNRRQAVRDNERRADGHDFFQTLLNDLFGFGVNVCRCFIQDDRIGLMCQGARKAEQLSLTLGIVDTAFDHVFFVLVGEAIDEVGCIDIVTCLFHRRLIDRFIP